MLLSASGIFRFVHQILIFGFNFLVSLKGQSTTQDENNMALYVIFYMYLVPYLDMKQMSMNSINKKLMFWQDDTLHFRSISTIISLKFRFCLTHLKCFLYR